MDAASDAAEIVAVALKRIVASQRTLPNRNAVCPISLHIRSPSARRTVPSTTISSTPIANEAAIHSQIHR